MDREKPIKVVLSRLFYIVFSVLFAFALWMYVEINENRIQTLTVSGVQVVRLNEDLLTDRGLLVAAMSPDSVTLIFECPRSVATKLNKNSLSIEIDLADITARGRPMLEYEIKYPSGIDVSSLSVSKSVERISLVIDRLETSSVNVVVSYKGGAADGYIQDPLEYTPQKITVDGPADVVRRVGGARVSVMRENLTTTYEDELPFTLLDESGQELPEALRDQLTFSNKTIHVTIPVRATKEVALAVEFNYGSGATQTNIVYSIDPPIVTVAGNPDDVRDFNHINLGTIDLTRFEFSAPYTFPIIIPNHFTNISGETEAFLFVQIVGLEIKYFSVSNIHILNEPPGYTAEIVTQSIDVRIRGKTGDMENLSEDNIRVVANLTDAGHGTSRVPATVYVDGIEGDVGAVGVYLITVNIVRNT